MSLVRPTPKEQALSVAAFTTAPPHPYGVEGWLWGQGNAQGPHSMFRARIQIAGASRLSPRGGSLEAEPWGGWAPHPSPGPSPERWKRREASRCRTERAACPSFPASRLSCRMLALFSWEAAAPGHSRSAWPNLGQGFFTSLCSTTKRLYRQSFKIIEEIPHLMTLRADIR